MTSAKELAKRLVDRKFVFCCNIVPSIFSIYFWKNEVHEDQEVLLIAKTEQENCSEVIQYLRSIHPYDEPVVIEIQGKYIASTKSI